MAMAEGRKEGRQAGPRRRGLLPRARSSFCRLLRPTLRPCAFHPPLLSLPARAHAACRPSPVLSTKSLRNPPSLPWRPPQVQGYCMFKDGREAKVAYPTDGMGDDVAGRSFHHGRCEAGRWLRMLPPTPSPATLPGMGGRRLL